MGHRRHPWQHRYDSRWLYPVHQLHQRRCRGLLRRQRCILRRKGILCYGLLRPFRRWRRRNNRRNVKILRPPRRQHRQRRRRRQRPHSFLIRVAGMK